MKHYIFDLDGTLACGKHRLHLLPTKDLHITESWIEFNKACKNDNPIIDTIHLMNDLYNCGVERHRVTILTGRSDDALTETVEWLALNGCMYDDLVMRSKKDNRKDIIIKEEFLRDLGLGNVIACWDDSPEVIKHFRSLGLTTYQVCDHVDIHNRTDLKSHGVEKL